MNKLQKTEADIIELITKWYSHKVAFPDSWSDERFLSSSPISYKTYDSGNIRYLNIEVTVDDVEHSFNLRNGSLIVASPLTKQLKPDRILVILNDIYTESTSIESIVEGQANLREKIANKKKELRRLNKSIKELEGQLDV